MIFKPYAYQQYCIDRIVSQPKIGLFLDMGLGKTVITLSALRELKVNRWAIGKVLVVAPKKVAEDTWQTEAGKWNHLRDLRVVGVLGTATQRENALRQPADVYVINRENVVWLVDFYRHKWPFDTVVLDESSSFKNWQAKRFRALRSELPRIDRLIELTGTPSPHGLMDLWAQVFLLDGGKALGRTISVYRDLFFLPDKRNRMTVYSWKAKSGAEQEIYAALSDLCVSMKSSDYLTLPELIYDDIPVRLDPAAQKAYDSLEREAVLAVDEETLTANNAAALSNKLLQLCNGAVYNEDGEAVEIHNCKIEALLEVVEQLNGQHAVICYQFVSDCERLERALAKTGLRVKTYRSAADKDAWNAGEIDLLLIHPASCGYGLNLQDGGHHIIWFGLTWNLEDYQQANKRLHRQGQKYPVIVHHLVVRGGRDEDVIQSLARKDATQEELLEALKARIRKAKEGIA